MHMDWNGVGGHCQHVMEVLTNEHTLKLTNKDALIGEQHGGCQSLVMQINFSLML